MPVVVQALDELVIEEKPARRGVPQPPPAPPPPTLAPTLPTTPQKPPSSPGTPYRSQFVRSSGVPAQHHFIPLTPVLQSNTKVKSNWIWEKQEALRKSAESDNSKRQDNGQEKPLDLPDGPLPLAAILKSFDRDPEMGKKNKKVTIGLQCDIPDPEPVEEPPGSSRPDTSVPVVEPPPKPEPPAEPEPEEPPADYDEPPPPAGPSTPPPPPPVPIIPIVVHTPQPEPEPPAPEPVPPPPPVVADDEPSDDVDSRPPTPTLSHVGSEHINHEIGDLAKSLDHLSQRFGQFLDAQSPNIMMAPMVGVGTSARNSTLRGSGGDDSSAWYKLGPHRTPSTVHNDDKDILLDEDEETKLQKRGSWGSHIEFILSCLGYAVGLGNVWRFPYLCYRNGGGAFFIPYFIMLFLVGIPIFFLELSLGQFTSSSPLTAWKFAPVLSGVGIGMCLVSTLVCIYYNMIIAYGFFYLFASFTSYLPWSDCDNYWNDDLCWSRLPLVPCNTTEFTKYPNGTCYNLFTARLSGLWNVSVAEENGILRQTSSQQYWDKRVLDLSDGIENMGEIRWELVLVLLCAWLIVFFCLSKGIKTSGKAVYFTAIFPYCVLLALVIRGVTLDGAADGIRFYTTADISRLYDARVWIDATNQIFFSLSDCFGGLITLASYNNFHRNVLRDTLIVSVGNCLTSIFAGFAVFSFLGYLAKELGITVDKVAKGGVDLAFVVYPEAIKRMPAIPPFWSILFFLMIITLGLDTMFALVETITSSLQDRFASLRKHKTTLVGGLCLVLFLMGLSLTTRGGIYMLQLMDSYGGAWAMLIIAIVESLGITWIYGPKNFIRDIRTMVGPKNPLLGGFLGYYWVALWGVVTPVLIVGVMLFSWVDFKPASYGDYIFPPWADALGLLMTTFIVIFIPIYAIYAVCTAKGTFLQRLWIVTSPTYDWGPALKENRILVSEYNKPNYIINVREYERAQRHNKMNPMNMATGTQYVNPTFEF